MSSSKSESESDSVLAKVAAAPAGEPPAVDPPQLGDRYLIEREIGRGGMGRVFVARDRRLARDVAIKLLPPGIQSEAALLRFEQEARAAALLAHPNIVVIHDIGNAGGAPYIVSELLQGCTLRARLAGERLGLPEALGLVAQLANGLAAAHDKGIVHRDLKPENLFITDEGRLKILDFGVAKLAQPPDEAGLASPAPHTETGAIVGTVGYMAPEQVRGEPVDPRADLFSVGVILYEMLGGHSAFRRGSRLETNYAIIHSEPEPLPAHVPSALQAIVRRCLRKERGERFQSARELHAALAQQSGARRRRLLWLAAAIPLAALGAWAIVRHEPAGDRRRITLAAADIDNQTREEELNGLSSMLVTSLEQSHRLSVLPRGRMFDEAKKLGKVDVERIDEPLGRAIARQTGADALVLTSISRFGEVYSIDLKIIDPIKNEYLLTAAERGKGKESILEMLDRLAERARAGLNEKAPEIRAASASVAQTTTANLEAYQHYFQGEQLTTRNDSDAAAREYRKAIALDPKFALAHFSLARAIGKVRDRPTEAASEELMTALRLGLPERERCLAEAFLTWARGHPTRAVTLIDVCAARFPDDKWILFEAGDWRFHSYDLAGAVPWLEKAFALDPSNREIDWHLAASLRGLGRADKLVELAEANAARLHDAGAFVQLATAQLFAHDRARAFVTLREAMRLFPEKASPVETLAEFHLFLNEPDQAESVLRPVIDGKLTAPDPYAPLNARLGLLTYRGRFRQAVRALDDAAAQAKARGAEPMWQGFSFWKGYILAMGPRDFAAVERVIASATDFGPDALPILFIATEDPKRALAAVKPDGMLDARLPIEALAAHARGDLTAAIAAHEKAAQVPYLTGLQVYKIARLQLEAGEPRKALAALSRVQETYFGGGLFSFTLFHPRTYYLAGLAHERLGESAAALAAYDQFLALWKDADPELTELRDAKARAAALRASAR